MLGPDRSNRLKELFQLAKELHGDAGAHRAFTFRSMSEHIDEVHDLWDGGDDHWKAETVDILIHCLLLLQNGDVPDAAAEDLLDQRLGRFREKITEALAEREGSGNA